MRLKHIKNADIIVSNSEYTINNPKDYKGKWNELFNNTNPIEIEIGTGKGKFIISKALNNKNINYIGIEKYDSVLAKSLPKIPDNLTNLAIIRMDALNIDNVFSKEISRIYLNFSDPWPKDRHHLRRLTSKVFLEKYDSIFKDIAEIYQRTDNQQLFIYSLESLSSFGYKLSDISFDLHNSASDDLITTEYEDKFSSKGMPIYSLVARK
jgi:tRNA (guanine-N7-)-methyltransferase